MQKLKLFFASDILPGDIIERYGAPAMVLNIELLDMRPHARRLTLLESYYNPPQINTWVCSIASVFEVLLKIPK
jgi:hypothetical protein